jgi:hypothetical protein
MACIHFRVVTTPTVPKAVEPEESAPGAVPPTGGVAPEDAPPNNAGPARERSATDDLADGIELIRRAARKAIGALDPSVEAAAERAVKRLQELDQQAAQTFHRAANRQMLEDVERLASEVGRDIESLVGRIASRVESALNTKK